MCHTVIYQYVSLRSRRSCRMELWSSSVGAKQLTTMPLISTNERILYACGIRVLQQPCHGPTAETASIFSHYDVEPIQHHLTLQYPSKVTRISIPIPRNITTFPSLQQTVPSSLGYPKYNNHHVVPYWPRIIKHTAKQPRQPRQ